MSDLTLLTQEQCFGSEKLDIFKKRGVQAVLTSFAESIGGYGRELNIESKEEIKKRKLIGGYGRELNIESSKKMSIYATKSMYVDNSKRFCMESIDKNGDLFYGKADARSFGIRPVLQFSSINEIPTNGIMSVKRADDGVLEVEYGFYPQKEVPYKMKEILEKAYRENSLMKTENKYISDGMVFDDNEHFSMNDFAPREHCEYEYNGKRYIRIEEIHRGLRPGFYSDVYQTKNMLWIEVSPIKWLVDEKAKIMVSEKAICGGIKGLNYSDATNNRKIQKFAKNKISSEELFNESNMKNFMDTYLSKEIEQVRKPVVLGELYNENGYDKDGYDMNGYNLYGFNRKGINKETKTKYDKNGYDKDGYDKNGYNCYEFNRKGINKKTKTKYNKNGYDIYGRDKNGNSKNKSGMSVETIETQLLKTEIELETLKLKKTTLEKRLVKASLLEDQKKLQELHTEVTPKQSKYPNGKSGIDDAMGGGIRRGEVGNAFTLLDKAVHNRKQNKLNLKNINEQGDRD